MKARYTGKTVCPDCGGSRLRKEALYVKIGGKTIADLVVMPVETLADFFASLELDAHDTKTAARILTEIRNRLQYLMDVGLGYLTLDRLSSTLSGGESQRINLSTSLGSNLVGSLYILDEPSIGLHPRDTNRLVGVLEQLRDIGNTVIVVEHEEEVIRAADWIVDIGPEAGYNGGEVVFSGPLKALLKEEKSLTADYLTGRRKIAVPTSRRSPAAWITVKGARQNNLKNIDVRIPLGVMTCITGVSGSGKSSLAKGILYPALRRLLFDTGLKPGDFDAIEGDLSTLRSVEMVDQNPIGKSSRSNPVTYIKAYDEIRKLYADQPYAQRSGFNPSHFSFNIAGGRCEECQGEGFIKVGMQFMADVELVCEACGGKRFKDEILEVRYREKSIYDILEMTVDDAIAFFGDDKKNATCKRIIERLRPLQEVGLGYIRLGQSSSTLSGGESQRVKSRFVPVEGEHRRQRDVHLRRAYDRTPFPRHQQAARRLQRPDRPGPHDRDRRTQHGRYQVRRLGRGSRPRSGRPGRQHRLRRYSGRAGRMQGELHGSLPGAPREKRIRQRWNLPPIRSPTASGAFTVGSKATSRTAPCW